MTTKHTGKKIKNVNWFFAKDGSVKYVNITGLTATQTGAIHNSVGFYKLG